MSATSSGIERNRRGRCTPYPGYVCRNCRSRFAKRVRERSTALYDGRKGVEICMIGPNTWFGSVFDVPHHVRVHVDFIRELLALPNVLHHELRVVEQLRDFRCECSSLRLAAGPGP